MIGFKKRIKSEETLTHFRNKKKKKKKEIGQKSVNHHEIALRESRRFLRRLRRKKKMKEVKSHIHRNNVVKNQLVIFVLVYF